MSEGQLVYSEINLSRRIWAISRKSSEVEAQSFYSFKKEFQHRYSPENISKIGCFWIYQHDENMYLSTSRYLLDVQIKQNTRNFQLSILTLQSFFDIT